MQGAEYYAAVYGFVRNEKGEILFGKRQNTGYKDDYYQVPAGHIEGNETCFEALKREMKEEVNIDIIEENVELVHVGHRINPDRVYFDYYYFVDAYSGVLQNNEPKKCTHLEFINPETPGEKMIVEYMLEIFKKVRSGESFSEIIIK